MQAQILENFQEANNDYLSSLQKQELLKYAQTVKSRLEIVEELKEKEMGIVTSTSDFVISKFPKVKARIDGTPKVARDLQLILRYCAQAALRDDPQFLEDQLLQWLRTVLVAFKFGNNVLHDSYSQLISDCNEQLSSEAFSLLEPYLKQVLTIVPQGENQ